MVITSVTRVTEPSYLAAVRESYDTVADAYLRLIPTPDRMEPLARAMLGAFAEIVTGPVADLGCGPGRLTAHLVSLGVPAFGVDVSPRMIANARSAFPDLRFNVGSMTALDIPDASVGGVLAFFSTFQTPPEWLPVVFGEFHRILSPGGHLLLGTYYGDDEHYTRIRSYGDLPVSYEAHFLPLERIVELLGDAGLVVTARLLEQGTRDTAIMLARSEPTLAAEHDVQNCGQAQDQR